MNSDQSLGVVRAIEVGQESGYRFDMTVTSNSLVDTYLIGILFLPRPMNDIHLDNLPHVFIKVLPRSVQYDAVPSDWLLH